MPEVKLLLVDDDAEDRMIMEEVFTQLSVRDAIDFAANGEEALGMLARYDPLALPSLIVMDQNMPRLTGTQTLRLLKADPILGGISVVMFSTAQNDEDTRACVDAGALGYLLKPTSFEEYLAVAQQLFAMAQQSKLTAHPGVQ